MTSEDIVSDNLGTTIINFVSPGYITVFYRFGRVSNRSDFGGVPPILYEVPFHTFALMLNLDTLFWSSSLEICRGKEPYKFPPSFSKKLTIQFQASTPTCSCKIYSYPTANHFREMQLDITWQGSVFPSTVVLWVCL